MRERVREFRRAQRETEGERREKDKRWMGEIGNSVRRWKHKKIKRREVLISKANVQAEVIEQTFILLLRQHRQQMRNRTTALRIRKPPTAPMM